MRVPTALAATALICGGLAACQTLNRERKPALPIPAAAPMVETPIAAVDRVLRETFRSYVGIGLVEDGAVRLTLADASEFASAAGAAREAWVLSARDDVRNAQPPRFLFAAAAAGAELLDDAFRRMRDVLTIPNVVFLDLDETCGCITVGIAEGTVAPQVASFAAQQGVASALVRTTVTPRIERMQSLRDSYRPTMAGVQIETGSTRQCTIGLPTWSFKLAKSGFLVASHCTEGTLGDLQNTRFFQPGGNALGLDGVAIERVDLPLFDANADDACPVGRRCRRSDVAFAEYNRDDFGIIGRVARPRNACTVRGTPCAVDVDRPTDDIRLRSGIVGLRVGNVVDKIGRTSGWTRGAITATCLNHNIHEDGTDTMVTMLCQTLVAATARPGDSGGPVFTFHEASGTGEFAGILSGGFRDPDTFVFTPIAAIEQELGGFVYNQAGLNGSFASNGMFYTGDVADEISVEVERGVVPSNEVQFVLKAGPGVHQRKEIALVEGATAPATGTGRWMLTIDNNVKSATEGLYTYQLAGGRVEFRKQRGSGVAEVTRVPIGTIQGGTRLTFTWQRD
jgi:hypothetical protein